VSPANFRDDMDDLVHSPVRFSLLASLARVDSADYQSLKEALDVSYPLLSKHAALLNEAGYIRVQKTSVGGIGKTRYRLTNKGRVAFEKHVRALERIIDGRAFTVHGSEPPPTSRK
jgi:DNA-binding MarR family transcriptional regulator